MVELRNKLKVTRQAYAIQTKGRVILPFAERRKAHARVALESGEEVIVKLPGGEILRGGDLVVASDGRIIEAVAAVERVTQISCATLAALARVAYHLGSEHVPMQVGDGYLRIASDHSREHVLRELGASLAELDAPFEPECGAHAVGHPHHGEHAEAHDHDHQHHGHAHDHDHDHGHKHDHQHDHGHHDHGHGHHHGHKHK